MHEAIVIDARCAGSPTIFLLAREECEVLLLDRAIFPSDMPFLQPLRHPDRYGPVETVLIDGKTGSGRSTGFSVEAAMAANAQFCCGFDRRAAPRRKRSEYPVMGRTKALCRRGDEAPNRQGQALPLDRDYFRGELSGGT
jgi:hypothetical protein